MWWNKSRNALVWTCSTWNLSTPTPSSSHHSPHVLASNMQRHQGRGTRGIYGGRSTTQTQGVGDSIWRDGCMPLHGPKDNSHRGYWCFRRQRFLIQSAPKIILKSEKSLSISSHLIHKPIESFILKKYNTTHNLCFLTKRPGHVPGPVYGFAARSFENLAQSLLHWPTKTPVSEPRSACCRIITNHLINDQWWSWSIINDDLDQWSVRSGSCDISCDDSW